jgi:Spy/CpxP family protein refolding chaperone
MINKNVFGMLRAVLLLLAAMVAMPAFSAGHAAGSSDMDIAREKIKADKKFVVAKNMELTEEEGKKFWPVYEAYQEDLQKINQRILKLVNEYADAYNKGEVTDSMARKLTDEAIDIEHDEASLKKSYVSKLSKVLPGVKVARYIQIESKVRAIVRYELAAAIPLAY